MSFRGYRFKKLGESGESSFDSDVDLPPFANATSRARKLIVYILGMFLTFTTKCGNYGSIRQFDRNVLPSEDQCHLFDR